MVTSSRFEDHALVDRSLGEYCDFELDDADFQSTGPTSTSYAAKQGLSAVFNTLTSKISSWRFTGSAHRYAYSKGKSIASPGLVRTVRRLPRRCCLFLYISVGIILLSITLTGIFRPSYTYPPQHYRDLRQKIADSKRTKVKHQDYGLANPENEKIFIAASLYDREGHLLGGEWGKAVLQLLDMLGNRNVFLSIYENGGGQPAESALAKFEKKVQCPHLVFYDVDFTIDEVPSIVLPDGTERTKRIAYLAEMRNKALLPLTESSSIKYDKLLFLNDVIFDPIEAAQLLMATNLNDHGRTSYRAACAVDFINPFKFYDTYATRDLQGYSMGVPFFPWFTAEGDGASRRDVLQGKDAVRVKSCWGGMVAFDARPFQAQDPLRFRAGEEQNRDASECCLIHADIMKNVSFTSEGDYVGIYLNPFIRVAYTKKTLSWLGFTRRFESLYTIPHNLVNRLVGLPRFNPHRTENGVAGASTWKEVSPVNQTGLEFANNNASQTANDGFCSVRMLQLIKEHPEEGERNWEMMPIPSR